MSAKKKLVTILLFFISIQVFTQDLKVDFEVVAGKNSYQIFAKNDELRPISVSFEFTLKNMKSTLPSNTIVVIPAESKHFLLATLSQINTKKSASYSYKNGYNFGDVNQTSHDEDYIYALPFEIGKTHGIYQGYNGQYSHQNQKALDFDMQMGEKIFAARGGKVVKVVSQFDKGCASISCADYNNEILIIHSDGTYGEYLHLQKNGAKVKLGDVVTKGQYIGNTGNTGWSKGPHLHFSVYLNRMEGDRYYIATKFKTSNKNPEIIKEKSTYKRTE